MFNLNHLFSHAAPSTSVGMGAPIAPLDKTAQAQTTAAAAPASDRVRAALDNVFANREKNASAQGQSAPAAQGATPASELEKIAAQAAQAAHRGHLKESSDLGKAMCDGFMSQLALYEKVAAEHASAQGAQGQPGASEAERQAMYAKTAEEMEELVQTTGANHWLFGKAAVESLAA